MSQLVEDRTTGRVSGWSDDVLVGAIAGGAAALVWFGATQVAGVDLAVRSGSGTQHINVISVIVTTLVVTLAGGGLLRALQRRTAKGRSTWTMIALVVWVLSLAGPLGARSLSAGLVLAGLHLLVGAVVILGLRGRHADRVA
jgi:hypothetical protein